MSSARRLWAWLLRCGSLKALMAALALGTAALLYLTSLQPAPHRLLAPDRLSAPDRLPPAPDRLPPAPDRLPPSVNEVRSITYYEKEFFILCFYAYTTGNSNDFC